MTPSKIYVQVEYKDGVFDQVIYVKRPDYKVGCTYFELEHDIPVQVLSIDITHQLERVRREWEKAAYKKGFREGFKEGDEVGYEFGYEGGYLDGKRRINE